MRTGISIETQEHSIYNEHIDLEEFQICILMLLTMILRKTAISAAICNDYLGDLNATSETEPFTFVCFT